MTAYVWAVKLECWRNWTSVCSAMPLQTSPGPHLHMTQHIITAPISHVCEENGPCTYDEITIDLLMSRHVSKASLHMPRLSLPTIRPFCFITQTNRLPLLSRCNVLIIHFMHFNMTPGAAAQFCVPEIFRSGLCRLSVQR